MPDDGQQLHISSSLVLILDPIVTSMGVGCTGCLPIFEGQFKTFFKTF